MKTLVKAGLITLSVLVLLAAATVITLKVMYPPEKVKALVLPLVTDAMQREVDLESAGLSIFPVLGVKLTGLSVANTARPGFSKDPFVTADAFIVKVSLPALLSGNVSVKSILLDAPRVIIETDRNGNLNTDDIGGPATAAKPAAKKEAAATEDLPFALTLDALELKDARFVYHDRQTGLKTVLGRINIRLGADADPALKDIRAHGTIAVGGISLNAPDVPADLPPLDVRIALDASVNTVDEAITIRTLTLSIPPVDLAVSGSVKEYGSDPVLDLSVNSGELDFNKILAAVPASVFPDKKDVKATGSALLSVTVKGKATETVTPKIDGTLKVNDVTMQYAGLPESINGFKADIRFTNNSADIKVLKLNLGTNPVSVKGTVKNFELPQIDMAVSAKVSLGSLKDVIELPEGTSLDGRLTADITAKGMADPAAPQKLNLKGMLQLSGVTVTTPELKQPMKIDAITNFSSKKISETMDIRIGTSDINVKASVNNVLALAVPQQNNRGPRAYADVAVTSNLLDLDAALNLPEETGGAPAADEKVSTADAQPVRIMTEPLPPVDAKFRYRFKRIRFYNADLTAFGGTAKLTNGRLTFNTGGRMYSGTVKASAGADLRDPMNVSTTVGAQLINVEANDFISRFNNLLPATNALYRKLRGMDNTVWGKLTLQSDFTSRGATDLDMTKNLAGTADIKVHKGKIARSTMLKSVSRTVEKVYTLDDITFDDLLVKARVKNEKVYLDEFTIGSGNGDWDVGGSVGFDAVMDCEIMNRLNKTVSDKLVGIQDKGKGALKGLLKGTALESAGSLVDGAGIPVDDAGRVTVLLGMAGDASSPKVTFKGFGKGTGSVAEQAGATTVKKQAAAQLSEKKEDVRKAVTRRTAETRKQVEAKAADAEKRVRAEADARKEQLAKEAAAKKKEAAAKAAQLKKEAEAKKKQLESTAKKKLKGLF